MLNTLYADILTLSHCNSSGLMCANVCACMWVCLGIYDEKYIQEFRYLCNKRNVDRGRYIVWYIQWSTAVTESLKGSDCLCDTRDCRDSNLSVRMCVFMYICIYIHVIVCSCIQYTGLSNWAFDTHEKWKNNFFIFLCFFFISNLKCKFSINI